MIHSTSDEGGQKRRNCDRQIVIAHTFPLLAEGLQAMLKREGHIVSTIDPRRLNNAAMLSDLGSKILITDCVGIRLLQCDDEMRTQPALIHALSQTILVVDQEGLTTVRDALPCQVTRMVAPTSDFSLFLDAVEAVIDGQSFIVSELKQLVDVSISADEPQLTDRQIEVLKLISDGLTSKEIGQRLGISRRTAEKHRANMKSVLQMNSTVELVLHGKRKNWVS